MSRLNHNERGPRAHRSGYKGWTFLVSRGVTSPNSAVHNWPAEVLRDGHLHQSMFGEMYYCVEHIFPMKK